ncbi:MAG TPA: transcription termination factor NusA [bacterium]|nr:transcription termination factor NusA [bacterium]HOR69336.1 transcription termination factor NusA [bacterium]HOS98961.1 transcription termination factor NusA [bacterium]HPL83336.1 transcription termination factor NusA [bacterium]HQE63111.1 transcription termination factor NusA [bacterium]
MSELMNAIKLICEEKNLNYEAVIEAIESALAAAYRKDYGDKNQNIKVRFNEDLSKIKVYDVKTVVEDVPLPTFNAPLTLENLQDSTVTIDPETKGLAMAHEDQLPAEIRDENGEIIKKFNPKTEIQLSEAKLIKPDIKVGDEIIIELPTHTEYGRMAAQTAKQVIIQKLREAERDMIYEDFKDKEKEVISGIVQRREGHNILVDVGKTVGIIPPQYQIPSENYRPNSRIKVFVEEVRVSNRGPEIILSRTADEILSKVFYLEIPEISNGLVDLKAVAREAGSRSKVAVAANSENVDPIGSCVGQRGSRIQTIINEVGGEKIDIIEYSDDPNKFIANALAPAKIEQVNLNYENKQAVVIVDPEQLSLAIGRDGQNVRLAARLTGWHLDIISAADKNNETSIQEVSKKEKTKKTKTAPEKKVKKQTSKTTAKKTIKKTSTPASKTKKITTKK